MTTTKKNIMLSTGYNLLLLAYPLVLSPYTSRVLGAENLGIYYYTYSVAHFFVLFAMLGLNNYGNRSISIVREDQAQLDEAFCSIYLMQALAALLSIAAYFSFVLLVARENKPLLLLQSLFVISALFDINWLFFGLEQFKLTVLRGSAVKAVSLALVFLLVKGPEDLPLYTGILSAGFLAGQAVMWRYVRRYVRLKRPRLSSCLRHIRPNLALFLPLIAVSVYRHMDKVMLGLLSEISQVGLYENADKIIVVPLSLINAFNTVMLPKLSHLVAKGGPQRVKRYIDQSMQIVMMTSCAISFGIAAIASEFAPFFFGAPFRETGTLIVWLAPTVLAIAWASVIRTQYLIPSGREKIYLGSVMAGATVNLIANWLLIESWGALGAVIGTILAQFSVAAFQTAAIRRELPVGSYAVKLLPYLLFGGIMFAAVRLAAGRYHGGGLPLILIEITVGAAVYGGLCLAYLIITRNEILKIIRPSRNKM